MLLRLALIACLSTGAARAETFSVALGGRVIGTLEYTPGRLVNLLDNTPLGVADGLFRGVTRSEGDAVRYVGESDERRIEVLFSAGRAAETVVEPAGERTALSDPGAVPEGVTDPVAGFGAVVGASECPGPIRMYDGRRTVEMTTVAREVSSSHLTCAIDYRVIAGPGHLSPFRLKSMDITAHYALASGAVSGLAQLDIRAGGFTLTLAPQ